MRPFTIRFASLLGIGVLVLCCSSCSPGKRFYPVRGQVLADGKPAGGVTVILYPADDPDPVHPLRPSGIAQADGSFEINSYLVKDRVLKTGAPTGHYRITCVWYPPYMQLSPGVELPDKLHGKYANPETSGLQAEVPEQATELPPLKLETHRR